MKMKFFDAGGIWNYDRSDHWAAVSSNVSSKILTSIHRQLLSPRFHILNSDKKKKYLQLFLSPSKSLWNRRKFGLPPKNFPFSFKTSLIKSRLLTTTHFELPKVMLKMSPYSFANSVKDWKGVSCCPSKCRLPNTGKATGPGGVFSTAIFPSPYFEVLFKRIVFLEKNLYTQAIKAAMERIMNALMFILLKEIL